MAYPGLAVVIMVGIGLGAILYYVFSEPERTYENSYEEAPPPHSSSTPRSSRTRYPSTVDECVICWDTLEESNFVRLRPCGHLYHPRCIQQWRAEGPTMVKDFCPICRNLISTATS